MFKANINNSQQQLLSCCFCDHVSPNINKLWLLLCYLRVPFQLASPPGFHFNTSRRGTLYMCIYYRYIIPAEYTIKRENDLRSFPPRLEWETNNIGDNSRRRKETALFFSRFLFTWFSIPPCLGPPKKAGCRFFLTCTPGIPRTCIPGLVLVCQACSPGVMWYSSYSDFARKSLNSYHLAYICPRRRLP